MFCLFFWDYIRSTEVKEIERDEFSDHLYLFARKAALLRPFHITFPRTYSHDYLGPLLWQQPINTLPPSLSVKLVTRNSKRNWNLRFYVKALPINLLGLRQFYCIFHFSFLYRWINAKHNLKVDDRLSGSQIPLYCPWQVKEFGHDKFENLVHVYVVSCTWEEKGRLHNLCICSGLYVYRESKTC